MDKTTQTFEVLREKCKQIGHGEWPIKLIIFAGSAVGFDEIDRPIIKFRANKEQKERVGDEE